MSALSERHKQRAKAHRFRAAERGQFAIDLLPDYTEWVIDGLVRQAAHHGNLALDLDESVSLLDQFSAVVALDGCAPMPIDARMAYKHFGTVR